MDLPEDMLTTGIWGQVPTQSGCCTSTRNRCHQNHNHNHHHRQPLRKQSSSRNQRQLKSTQQIVRLNTSFFQTSFLLVFITIITLVLKLGPGGVKAINGVLDLKGTFPYLLDRSTGSERVIEPRDYMDFENLYAPNETYKLKETAQGRNYYLIKAFDFANYFQSDYWHYSRREDLERSAEPVAEPRECSRQLDWLERQLNRSQGEALFHPGEQHINLMSLVDSYGHPETATYYGHGYWLGSYHECTRTTIDLVQYQLEECLVAGGGPGLASARDFCQAKIERELRETQGRQRTVKFRYCVGKARDVDWPANDNYVPRISYKVGVCLPETCETLSFSRDNHAAQIERLMRFNLPEYTRDRIKLSDIYCVPDPRSPIRRLPLSARLFLGLLGGWLAMLVCATILYSCHKRHMSDLREITRGVAATAAAVAAREHLADETHQLMLGASQPVVVAPKLTPHAANGVGPNSSPKAITQYANNLSTSPGTLTVATKNAPVSSSAISKSGTSNNHSSSSSSNNNNNNNNARVDSRKLSQSNVSQRSDVSSSSRISAWLAESPLLIKALQAMSIKETLREFQQPPPMLNSPGAGKRLRVNLNALDAIKCLCCILVIFGHIIFIHMQHLSNIVHTIELSYGIGPRLLCAFFNFVDTFFIISGMLTAYFIFKRFNKRTFANPLTWLSISLLRLLRLSPVYILVFWFIKTTGVHISHGPIWDYGTDDKSIKGLCMNDHWWKSILYFGNVGTMQPLCILPAWSIIVDAQYSLVMPAIIFVLFKHKRLGYLLLLLATVVSATKMTIQLANQTAVKTSDMAKIRLHVYPLISRFAAEFYNTAWNRIGPVAIGIFGGRVLYLYEIGAIRRWPAFMRGPAFKLVLLLHLILFLLPTIGLYVDDPGSTGETDVTIFLLSNATIKPIWSIIQTILLLRLITDLRSHSVLARLMSHNLWHCLGKLCFTSYLIHYEIILTMLKSRQEGLIDPNWSNALREFSAVFLISTVISYLIYIFYEAPMNKLIMLAFSRHAESLKRKVDKQLTGDDGLAGVTLTTNHTQTGSECNNNNNNNNKSQKIADNGAKVDPQRDHTSPRVVS